MEIMVAKNLYDAECENNFELQTRGHVACCGAMQRLTETSRRSSSARDLIIGTRVDKDKTIHPSVRFQYGSNLPGTEQKVCPFCGKEHTVTVTETLSKKSEMEFGGPDYF